MKMYIMYIVYNFAVNENNTYYETKVKFNVTNSLIIDVINYEIVLVALI